MATPTTISPLIVAPCMSNPRDETDPVEVPIRRPLFDRVEDVYLARGFDSPREFVENAVLDALNADSEFTPDAQAEMHRARWEYEEDSEPYTIRAARIAVAADSDGDEELRDRMLEDAGVRTLANAETLIANFEQISASEDDREGTPAGDS